MSEAGLFGKLADGDDNFYDDEEVEASYADMQSLFSLPALTDLSFSAPVGTPPRAPRIAVNSAPAVTAPAVVAPVFTKAARSGKPAVERRKRMSFAENDAPAAKSQPAAKRPRPAPTLREQTVSLIKERVPGLGRFSIDGGGKYEALDKFFAGIPENRLFRVWSDVVGPLYVQRVPKDKGRSIKRYSFEKGGNHLRERYEDAMVILLSECRTLDERKALLEKILVEIPKKRCVGEYGEVKNSDDEDEEDEDGEEEDGNEEEASSVGSPPKQANPPLAVGVAPLPSLTAVPAAKTASPIVTEEQVVKLLEGYKALVDVVLHHLRKTQTL